MDFYPERRKALRVQRSQRIASGTGIGVPLAILVSWLLRLHGIEVTAEVSAALGAVIGVAVVCLNDIVSSLGRVAFIVVKRKLGIR